MIVAQLIGAVRVSRDYVMEIDFKISERQLGLEREQPARTPKSKNGVTTRNYETALNTETAETTTASAVFVGGA